ncbi:MAG: hypothetical protein ACYDAI_09050 [Trichloromonadaceae bacterium]
MKDCSICGQTFDPEQKPLCPDQEAGVFLAAELYNDVGQLCLACLGNRGKLGMMYCTEFYG